MLWEGAFGRKSVRQRGRAGEELSEGAGLGKVQRDPQGALPHKATPD